MDNLYISKTENGFEISGIDTGDNYGSFNSLSEAIAEAKFLICIEMAQSYCVESSED